MKNNDNPAIQKAITELEGLIRRSYPQAVFSVFTGDDPEGIYVRVLLDVEDADVVVDVYLERLLYFQIEERLPLYLVPVRSLSTVHKATQAQRDRLNRHTGTTFPLSS
jgi:hypothetical protein